MDKTWKTLIIDDEALARQRLSRLLAPHAAIQLIGEAASGPEALELINRLQPDLIFLDIEMPVWNGFELLKKLDKPVRVIFTTAYDQYALRAFEEESVDYLLKPIAPERLARAVEKINRMVPSAAPDGSLEKLILQLQPKKVLSTLTVKSGDRILLLKTAQLVYAEAEDKYVMLHTSDGRKHLTDCTLSALEEKLPDAFIRISRSLIIHTVLIQEIRKGFNGAYFFLMDDQPGSKLHSSRGYGPALKDRLDL